MSKYDPQIHHRRSIRLKGYDYTQPGAYFITLAAWRGEHLFGEIVHHEMQLSPLGRIVQEEWARSNAMRREICLNEDEFVIMPNHIHGIVWIVAAKEAGALKTGAYHAPVRADGIRPSPPADGIRPSPAESGAMEEGGADKAGAEEMGAEGTGAYHAPVRADGIRPGPPLFRPPRSLPSFVAGFKSAVSSRAKRELGIERVWQRNYYEHIIRNEQAFQNIWNYIDNNPRRWEDDPLHTTALRNPFNQE